MQLVIPDDAKPLILDSLKTLHPEFRDPYGTEPSGLNALVACSELARDSEITESLLKVLCCPALGFRQYALRVLAEIGHPATPDHLIYNSLRVHPLLNHDQGKVSGWNDMESLRSIGLLGERHFTALLGDLVAKPQTFHGDLLGRINLPDAVERLRPLLQTEGKTRILVAYSLALRGNRDGQDVLKKSLDERRFAPLAIRALCLSQDVSAIKHIEPYAFSKVPYFHIEKKETEDYYNSRLVKLAQEAIELLSATSRDARFALFKRLYTKTAEDLRQESSNIREALEGAHTRRMQRRRNAIAEEMHERRMSRLTKIDPQVQFEFFTLGNMFAHEAMPSAADFIERFLDPEQQKALVEMQMAGVRKLLGSIDKRPEQIGVSGRSPGWSVPWRGLVPTSHDFEDSGASPYYIRGFQLSHETEDFVSASTGWISNPSRYCEGTSRYLYDYLFAEIQL